MQEHTKPRFAAIILSAGSGSRAKTKTAKQYQTINNKPILEYSLDSFIKSNLFTKIVIAVDITHKTLWEKILQNNLNKITIVKGGKTRQESTLNSLISLSNDNIDYVFIHDAARPFVSSNLLNRLSENIIGSQAVIPALPISDTIKKVTNDNFVLETIAREDLFAAQTPQLFDFSTILNFHKQASEENITSFTDDSSIAEYFDMKVKIIPGERENIKITWPEDFLLAEYIVTKGKKYD